jgi:hypothetical protein
MKWTTDFPWLLWTLAGVALVVLHISTRPT